MSEDVVQSLKQTVVRLEKELESYKSRDVKRREQLGAGFVWLAKVLARRDLRVAAKAWWSKFQETKPELPGEESVLLLGAFGNRVLTVGLFGAVVAAFPALLLLTQTGLLAYQNYQFGIESAAARRAQLIATLYDKECLWSEETPIEADEGASEDVESTSTPNEASNKSVDERCRPVASVRARSEAVVALHQMGGRDFKKADLHDADFREADLWEADFRWADLRDAGFRDANLEGATLREANLRGADLEGANLRMARLEGASLREADLEGVHLEVARLEGARLEGARLEGARLARANLFLAKLKGARLREANLEGAHLKGANLEGADLSLANFEGANLRGANLEGAGLAGTNLEGALRDQDDSSVLGWSLVANGTRWVGPGLRKPSWQLTRE